MSENQPEIEKAHHSYALCTKDQLLKERGFTREIVQDYIKKPLESLSPSNKNGLSSLECLLGEIGTDPMVILEMPFFPPIGLMDFENETVSYCDFASHKVRQPVWSQSEPQQYYKQIDNWAKNKGFNGVEELYEDLPIGQRINLLSTELSYNVESGTYRTADILNDLKRKVYEKLYAKEELDRARDIIARYLPQALPNDETEVVFTTGYKGEYKGKVGNKNYILDL